MNINELHEFNLRDAVRFHTQLNPRLFDGETLLPSVRRRLLEIAEDFIQFMGITDLDVKDITISGSNAAYSYTPHSDIDLHLVVDIDRLGNDEVYRELFTSKKTLYNEQHGITIGGYPVEVYVQDSTQPHVSLGEYSVENNRWVKFPSKRRANLDERGSRAKFQQLVEIAELALRSDNVERVGKLLKVLKRYRQAGLEVGGEFGPENVAFKAMKHAGYLDRLYKHRQRLHGRELSLPEAVDEASDSRRPTWNIGMDNTRTPYRGSPTTAPKRSDPLVLVPRLVGSYTDQQLRDAGAVKGEDGRWRIPRSKSGNLKEGASGYIPSDAERHDPRFKTALTVDIKPGTLKQNARKLGWNIARDGRPPLLRPTKK